MSTPNNVVVIGAVIGDQGAGVASTATSGLAAAFKHPDYVCFELDWKKMRHTYAGQRAIKEQAAIYLPPTGGMILDGMGHEQLGMQNYRSYLRRAKFHGFVESAVTTYSGLLEQKPSKFVLTPKLESLVDMATKNGETLDQLLSRIHTTQLQMGRIGLLFDIDTSDPLNPVPYISTYEAESILNWDGGNSPEGVNRLKMVLLDETTYGRESAFNWSLNYRYRALMLGDGINNPDSNSTYSYSLYSGKSPDGVPDEQGEPSYKGAPLKKIPFVFIGPRNTLPDIDKSPLDDLADLSLTLYRTEADYRQNLYMQGQDTLVIIGGRQGQQGESLRTGAGASIYTDVGGDAKYIGVNSQGLPELRMAVQNDVQAANEKAGHMVSQAKANAESGEAMGTRLAAQTATLNSIAMTAAAALQFLLRVAAEWMGDDPTKVFVTPNLEFTDFTIPGQEIQAVVTAKSGGLPISYESLHGVLVDKGLTKMTWEEEQAAMIGDKDLRTKWGLPDLDAVPAPALGTKPANTDTTPNPQSKTAVASAPGVPTPK